METDGKAVLIHQGQKWREGDKDGIMHANNKELNDFVFASPMARRAKDNAIK